MSLRTEQEQLEAFSNWWKANGMLVVVTVIVLLSSYLGWSAWQKHQQTQAAEASAIFQKILDQKSGNAGDTTAAKTSDLADQLKKDYPGTYYGQAVRLLLAEEAVKNGNLELAEKELTALVQQKPEDILAFTARLRLARVLFAQGKYDDALAQLTGDVSETYTSLFSELKGDVLAAQMQPDRAKDAYVAAISSLPKGSEEQKRTIEMKLNNLATAPAVEK